MLSVQAFSGLQLFVGPLHVRARVALSVGFIRLLDHGLRFGQILGSGGSFGGASR
jgi:hypothetical protein